MRDKDYRCIYCGKYVSYDDIMLDRVKVLFTPDTQYTEEKTEMYHVECEARSRREEKQINLSNALGIPKKCFGKKE